MTEMPEDADDQTREQVNQLRAKGNADVVQYLRYGRRSTQEARGELMALFIHMQEENDRVAMPEAPLHESHNSQLQFHYAKTGDVAKYLRRYGGDAKTYEDYIAARDVVQPEIVQEGLRAPSLKP